jgi:hypothetical protein
LTAPAKNLLLSAASLFSLFCLKTIMWDKGSLIADLHLYPAAY